MHEALFLQGWLKHSSTSFEHKNPVYPIFKMKKLFNKKRIFIVERHLFALHSIC